MKNIHRIAILGLLLSLLTLESGCALQEKIGTITTELREAYENLTTKLTNLTQWTTQKVDQVQQATEDVKEAAESVDQAIDSVQTITGAAGRSAVSDSIRLSASSVAPS